MNVLTLGARVIGIETAVCCSEAFLGHVQQRSRHRRRVGMIGTIEAESAEIAAAHKLAAADVVAATAGLYPGSSRSTGADE